MVRAVDHDFLLNAEFSAWRLAVVFESAADSEETRCADAQQNIYFWHFRMHYGAMQRAAEICLTETRSS